MLLILTAAGDRSRIMRAVMDHAGVQSPAHTVMFSLPVESVGGPAQRDGGRGTAGGIKKNAKIQDARCAPGFSD